jgi:hypothetical protein
MLSRYAFVVVAVTLSGGPKVSTSAAGRLHRRGKPLKPTGLLTWLALFFGIATGGTVAAASNTAPVPASNAPTQAQVATALQITEIDWHKGGWNNMMLLDVTVRNNGKRDVKDIKVVCDHSSSGETKIDSNSATIYGPFPAGKSKSIHEFDMGVFHDQATRTNCSIVHATLTTKRWGRTAG